MPPVKNKTSTEFKLLMSTQQIEKTSHSELDGEMNEVISTSVVATGKPSPLTIVAFRDRRNADIAFDQVTEYNKTAELRIHVAKLYA